MRLLRRTGPGNFAFHVFNDQPPAYAILSHTWGNANDEVKLKDIEDDSASSKPGYAKLEFCAAQTAHDGLQYFWIDSCCIDQTNNVELTEAINSMYRWYYNASKCYVYLPEVSVPDPTNIEMPHQQWLSTWDEIFRSHRWFTRGWTLQELIAARSVEFFSKEHTCLGSKESLEQVIQEITAIPAPAIRGSLDDYSYDERMSWVGTRATSRPEDMAYCLLGILKLSMPMIYGEGQIAAMSRLRREIAVQNQVDEAVRNSGQYRIPLSLSGVPLINKFVDRAYEMGRLEDSLLPSREHGRRKVAVMCGLGGIGKTQLSVEFVRRHKDTFSTVFWLDGRSEDSLKQSLALTVFRIPPGQLPKGSTTRTLQTAEDINAAVQDVLTWLSTQGNSSWLLVFDNVDIDFQSPTAPPEAFDPRTYFPSADHGSILITTRLLALGRLGTSIKVGRVSREQALTIFKNDYESEIDQSSEIDALLILLDGLPLAIVQAAAYVHQTSVPISEYIEFYTKEWKSLMCTDNDEISLSDYKNGGLGTTWMISFKAIQKRDSTAAKLLLLWACLDYKDLWFEMFTAAHKAITRAGNNAELEWFTTVTSNKLVFTQKLRLLLAYSLVEGTQGSSSYAMHPVVHEWAWQTQERNIQSRNCWLAAIVLGWAAPMDDEKEYWVLQRRLLRHADRYARCSSEDAMYRTNEHQSFTASTTALDASNRLGCFYRDQGKLTQAEQIFRRVLDRYEKVLDAYHTSILSIVNNLGRVYADQGRLTEAQQMCKWALEGKEKTLGAEHLSTLIAVENLGILYGIQGKLGEAGQLFKRVLEGREMVLGANHELTLEIVSKLGSLYTDQGKLAEAEQMQLRAVEGYEKTLGPDHIWTLNTIHSLSILYLHQGNLGKAEQMAKRALKGQEVALGHNHISTLTTVSSLGTLYAEQGKLVEAEQMLLRGLEGKEKALGTEHVFTLETVNNLGYLYFKQGKLAEAELMYLRVLDGKETEPGARDRITPSTAHNLAQLYEAQGRIGDSEQMYMRALKGKEQSFGADHISTLETVSDLGVLYKTQGKVAEAERMFKRAVKGLGDALGPEHPSTITALKNLENLYREQGKPAAVEPM